MAAGEAGRACARCVKRLRLRCPQTPGRCPTTTPAAAERAGRPCPPSAVARRPASTIAASPDPVSCPRKIVLAIVAALAIAAACIWLPVAQWIGAAIEYIRALGPIGLVLYATLFIATSLLLIPMAPVFLAAGMLYGVGWGTVLLTVLSIGTELITLALVRTRARAWIEQCVRKHEKLAAVDKGIEEHSLALGSLLRLSMLVPYAPLNYGLAVTKMPVWQHIVTNAIGMTPCNLLMAYAGSLLSDATSLDGAELPGVWTHVALWGSIAVTLVAGVLTSRASKHALQRQRQQHAHA